MNCSNSRWLAVAATAMVLVSTVALTGNSVASGAERSSGSASGVWPGVGQICGPGPGGASSVRGVSTKTINVAVFTDAANTVQPGLDVEFPQFAGAFAKWCNAAGSMEPGAGFVVDTEDGALFNAGQVMTQACQKASCPSGAVYVLDTAAVPIRVACGLGQITPFTVSDQSVDAALQVNPGGINNSQMEAGWYGALAKKSPKAIKDFGTGGANQASILEQEHKDEQATVAQGYKVVDFQEPPLSVTDWAPYIEEAQSKGVEALEPAASSNVGPYFEAMQTAGYNPAFVYMYANLYVKATAQATASMHLPPTYLALVDWPFELASQSPGLTELDSVMHKYAPGTAIDQNDELAATSWVLFAKSATACGANLTVSCVLSHAAAQKNWTRATSRPRWPKRPCRTRTPPRATASPWSSSKAGSSPWDKSLTDPNNQIWHCDPKTLFKVSSAGG